LERIIRLATRGSPLARLQAERVGSVLSGLNGGGPVELVIVKTSGDLRSTVPLSAVGGQGVFVKEVQQAVLDGIADAAVHSAKDLPATTPDGLVIACVPERADPRDAMVGKTLEDLRPGATVATGSARRRAQIAWLRPDLTFCELRGSIQTRIDRSEAIGSGVVALAALERLGLTDRIASVLEPSEMLPQIGQGALAVECRVDDTEMLDLLASVDDRPAHVALDAERSYLRHVGGGCSAPVAAFAQVGASSPEQTGAPEQRGAQGAITLEGMISSHDGRIMLRRTMSGSDPVLLGRELAHNLLVESGGSVIELWSRAEPLRTE